MSRPTILVLGTNKIHLMVTSRHWAVIQIATGEEGWAELPNKANLVDRLRLNFADLDHDYEEKYALREQSALFDEAHAERILDFYTGIRKRISYLLVQCHLGYSRSPAVAAALSKIFYGSDSQWFGEKYCPNMRVYRTIINLATKTGRYCLEDFVGGAAK